MPIALRDERRAMKVETKVLVVGFKTPSRFSDPKYAKYESDYVAVFAGKEGIIESVDDDKEHPYTIFFGEEALPRRFRFSAAELRLA